MGTISQIVFYLVRGIEMLSELEIYAQTYNIPIMEKEGIEFMCNFIKTHKTYRILELGTAIGYSTIQMAMVDPKVKIVTIERDEKRYKLANENIKKYNCSNQITTVLEDALTYDTLEMFDLIFIDAAKSQYIKFFERYENNLEVGGYIISDNLKFHGFVDHPERIQSRNLRQMIGKIKRYVDYLENHISYETTFLDIGDGIAISKKQKK